MKDVLNVGQLVLPLARGLANSLADATCGEDDERHKQQQDPCQFPAQQHDHESGEDQGEQLLKEFRQHAGHGKLHPLNVIHYGGDQSAGGVFLVEGRRTPQDRVVQFIA